MFPGGVQPWLNEVAENFLMQKCTCRSDIVLHVRIFKNFGFHLLDSELYSCIRYALRIIFHCHWFMVQVAKQMGPGHMIVTCLCDSGQVSSVFVLLLLYREQYLCHSVLQRYYARLFNQTWLQSKGKSVMPTTSLNVFLVQY